MAARSPILTFDEVLTHYIGEFGRGQRQHVAILSLFGVPNGLMFLLWVMVTVDPIKTLHWQCTDPGDLSCSAVHAAPTSHAFCQLPAGTWHWTNTDSLVAYFNLICTDSWKIQFVNCLMFIGCFIGSGLFGTLSDKIGRKIPMFAATALSAAATYISLAAPNYWFVAVMRLLAGMGAAGQVQGVILLSMETTGRSYRGIAGIPQVVMFCIGEYILVAIAYSAPNWHSLYIAAGTICAATLLLYPIVPESARWLMSQQGREEQALGILRNISVKNGSRMPEDHLLPRSRSSVLVKAKSTADFRLSSDQLGPQHRARSMPALHSINAINRSTVVAPAAVAGIAAHTYSEHSKTSNSISSTDDNDAVVTELDTTAVAHAQEPHSEVTCSKVELGPHRFEDDYLCDSDGSTTANAVAAAPAGLLELLKQPAVAGMSAVMVLTWFTNFVTFYSIALGTGGLPGTIHTTFVLNVTGQIVATLLAGALVDKLGRHNVISTSLTAGGLACLMCANINNRVAQIVLATIGQFGCTASLAVTPTYTAELYPTAIRSTALGICSKACRLGSIAAPFLVMLGVSAGIGSAIFLPYMICGSVCFVAGVLVLFMPETLGRDMPETMEDLHQLQTVFSAKPWKQGGVWGTVAFLFRVRAGGDTDTCQTLPRAVQSGGKNVECI